MATTLKWKKGSEVAQLEESDCRICQQLIGCILHLANTIKPDICFAAVFLSRAMHTPTVEQQQTGFRLLGYLEQTSSLGIEYKYGEHQEFKMEGYSDADSDSDAITRKSVTGYNFCAARVIVTWRSKQQSVVAPGSVEAEFFSPFYGYYGSKVVREILFFSSQC